MIKSVWARRTASRRLSKKRLLSVEVFYQSGRKWSDKIGCSLNDLLPTVPPIFTCFCLKTLPSLGPISFFWPKFVNCLDTVCCQARVVFIFLVSAFMSHPSSDALLLNCS